MGYPIIKIKSAGGDGYWQDQYLVLAEMRPGVYEDGFVQLEPEEGRRLRKAFDEGGDLEKAMTPLLVKALGWLPHMIPPGPEPPSLANRAPNSRVLKYGQWRIKKQKKPSLIEKVSHAYELPDLGDLKPDTPLTLAEACRLVFRDHIKPATLRAEARRGHLVIERIGRRDFVTLAALGKMRERCGGEPA